MFSIVSNRPLIWWAKLLFIIGSALFAIGSIQLLAGQPGTSHVDFVYFSGSVFFTLAATCQFADTINTQLRGDETSLSQAPKKISWQFSNFDLWAAFPQLLGTFAFNLSTLAAYFDVGWLGYDITNWAPDYVGSALFLLSGGFALLASRNPRAWSRDREIAVVNFVGCAAFMISATLAFVRPDQEFVNLATWATFFTLIGSICFLIGAILMKSPTSDSDLARSSAG